VTTRFVGMFQESAAGSSVLPTRPRLLSSERARSDETNRSFTKGEHRMVLVVCECGHARHVKTRIVLGTDQSAPFSGLCHACALRARCGTVRGETVKFTLSEPDAKPHGWR
jgi:hypothetical protein